MDTTLGLSLRNPTLLMTIFGANIVVAVATPSGPSASVDVLVYGGTPGGAVAAIAAKRVLGVGVVVLVEGGHHIGGMLAAGMIDDSIQGDTQAYAGLAAELYRRTALAYKVSPHPDLAITCLC